MAVGRVNVGGRSKKYYKDLGLFTQPISKTFTAADIVKDASHVSPRIMRVDEDFYDIALLYNDRDARWLVKYDNNCEEISRVNVRVDATDGRIVTTWDKDVKYLIYGYNPNRRKNLYRVFDKYFNLIIVFEDTNSNYSQTHGIFYDNNEGALYVGSAANASDASISYKKVTVDGVVWTKSISNIGFETPVVCNSINEGRILYLIPGREFLELDSATGTLMTRKSTTMTADRIKIVDNILYALNNLTLSAYEIDANLNTNPLYSVNIVDKNPIAIDGDFINASDIRLNRFTGEIQDEVKRYIYSSTKGNIGICKTYAFGRTTFDNYGILFCLFNFYI